MTYTINQNVDVNAQVDIGDLNIHGHTISNSQNGTIVITTGSESHLDITYGAHISNLVLSGNDIGTKSSNANLTFTPHGSGIVKSNAAFEVGNINLTDNTISSTDTNGNIILAPDGTGTVRTDNLQFDGNTISSTNTDGDIVLSPNGSGNVGIGTSSPGTKLHVNGYQTFYDVDELPGFNSTGDKVPTKIILGNDYCPQIRTYYPNVAYTDSVDLEFWTCGQNVVTDSMSSRLTIKAQSGNVGIGTSSPGARLDVYKDYSGQGAGTTAALLGGTDSGVGWSGVKILEKGSGLNSSDTYVLNAVVNASSKFVVNGTGFVGIGTSTPKAPLEVFNANAGVTLNDGYRQYFDYQSGPNKDTNAGWSFNDISIFARGDIVGNGYILSHSSTTFSDRRIKDNIVDVEDDQCLQTLRLIKPKQYTYRDTAKRGTEPVWGFIAQEVKEVLPYSVETIEKEIPNIYKLATVSSDRKTLIFPEPIVFEDEHKRVVLKTHQNKDVEVVIVSHTPTSLTLEEEIEQQDISVENQVFVYGQVIPDFHHLKKDSIFTVAVSAIQEIDRRQTTDNERILELEGDLSEAQETIITQDQRIAALEAQVAALMQHTGVTI